MGLRICGARRVVWVCAGCTGRGGSSSSLRLPLPRGFTYNSNTRYSDLNMHIDRAILEDQRTQDALSLSQSKEIHFILRFISESSSTTQN